MRTLLFFIATLYAGIGNSSAQLAEDWSPWDFRDDIKEILEVSREKKITQVTFDAIDYWDTVRRETNLLYSWTSDSTLTLVTEFSSKSQYLKSTAYLQRVNGVYFTTSLYKLNTIEDSKRMLKCVQGEDLKIRLKLSSRAFKDTTVVKAEWFDGMSPILYYFSSEKDLLKEVHLSDSSMYIYAYHDDDSMSVIYNDDSGYPSYELDIYTVIKTKIGRRHYEVVRTRYNRTVRANEIQEGKQPDRFSKTPIRKEYVYNKKGLPELITAEDGATMRIRYDVTTPNNNFLNNDQDD